MPHHTDSQEWLFSNQLYERHLLCYCVMGLFWFFVGLLTLDFNVEGFSSEQVLFFNMAWFLVICSAFFFPLFWYRLILGKNNFLLKDRRAIQDELDNLDEEVYDDVYAYNVKMGSFPPNRLEVFCLGLLFSFMLFDVFYLGVWVSNQSALLWQPAWADWGIAFIKNHLSLPPIHETEGIFYYILVMMTNSIKKPLVMNEHYLPPPWVIPCYFIILSELLPLSQLSLLLVWCYGSHWLGWVLIK